MQVASRVAWKQDLKRCHQASVFSLFPLLVFLFTSVPPCFFLIDYFYFLLSLIYLFPFLLPLIFLSLPISLYFISLFPISLSRCCLSPVVLSPFSLFHPSLTPFLPTSPPSFCLTFCLSSLSPSSLSILTSLFPHSFSPTCFSSVFLSSLLQLIFPLPHFCLSPPYLSHLWTSS